MKIRLLKAVSVNLCSFKPIQQFIFSFHFSLFVTTQLTVFIKIITLKPALILHRLTI